MIESMLIRLAIIAVALAVSFASGFGLGVTWEGNRRDAAELKAVKEVQIKIQRIVEEREKIVKVFVTKIVRLQAEKDRITTEVDKHVSTIPDPRECWLDPERVRVINDAVGAAGERSPAAAVPAAKDAPVGEPQRSGAVGGGLHFPLPRMFASPGGLGEDPEISR